MTSDSLTDSEDALPADRRGVLSLAAEVNGEKARPEDEGRPVTIIVNTNIDSRKLRGDWDQQVARRERERAQRALPARREGIDAGEGQSQSEQPR